MKDTTPKITLLEDYRPLPFSVKTIDLTFELDDTATVVTAISEIARAPKAAEEALTLYGRALKLLDISIDGRQLLPDEYSCDEKSLVIHRPPESFSLKIVTEINPSANSALEGLYKSGTIYCTQNEPQGFRRITYFLDRPDVMTVYTTTLIADKERYPILLSNGNKVESGDLEQGKHWVKWNDPFPKPSYLYAIVGGDLGQISDSFTTKSGRKIQLYIYCDKGNEQKCTFAMEALKRAMKWDEDVFGLEYDLDIFMIVAVDAFNMGAMENKGLNIFNTSCVLADKATATDENFYRVETVVAHEYFHNWTGNRVTCRDWFQLTLKEGLTVFRDQEFSSDINSRAVKRIEDVQVLRANQFAEDAGPTSHPIKPSSYMEINNFYTTTIYNKGAEVIRMIQTFVGRDRFRKGIDRYFELFDGQAVTTEDFIRAMEEGAGVDLKEFTRWYHQSGTPELEVKFHYHPISQTFELDVKQLNPPTADQPEKKPLFFPLACGLLGENGESVNPEVAGYGSDGKTVVLTISKERESFLFKNVKSKPILSINRGFSAPIKIKAPYERKDLLFLMSHDCDPFNRWDASQEIGIRLMLESLKKGEQSLSIDEGFLEAFGKILNDHTLDHSLKALCLALPSEEALGQRQEVIDFDGNHRVREELLSAIALHYEQEFFDSYEELSQDEEYHLDPVSIGKRSLKNLYLRYLVQRGNEEAIALCYRQFLASTNMTDQYAALAMLVDCDCPQKTEALQQFYNQWKEEQLVMCKWLGVQALSKVKGTLSVVEELVNSPIYDQKIPNIVRALLGGFMLNQVQFNDCSGKGYLFVLAQILKLDAFNPQIAARLAGGFKKFNKLDKQRKALLGKELKGALNRESLSANLYEIISKIVH